MQIVNPATGVAFEELADDTPRAVADKAARARGAQPAWAARPYPERHRAIAQFNAALTRDKDRLAQLLSRETGKPITQARNEIAGTGPRIDYFLAQTEHLLQPEKVHVAEQRKRVAGRDVPELEERIAWEPLGVVANISAWNYPYFVGTNVFIPALLCGNAVLYKPSEHATLSGLAIAELLYESGVPRDVFVPVVGAGQVGAALLEQAVDGVFFTGSYRTGKRIAEAVAGKLIRVQLELGGKDPVYVRPDVDVGAAAAGLADGAFYNTGQSCCSVERIYVHERIYDAFVDAFVVEVGKFVVGDPADEATYIGPLTREPQLAVLDAQVKDAVAKGARLLTGGQRLNRQGCYFAPTVLADATHAMELMREESFGPIIGIQRVRDDDEAVTRMNDTEYGLTAGVYTADPEAAERLMARLQAGSVYWNCCDRVSPRLPWTGRKHSGVGSTLSRVGIQAFVQPKAWHLRAP